MRNAVAMIASVVLLAACSFAPKYERPAVDTPQAWRDAPTQGLSVPADKWWTVFSDPALDKLIAEAFAHNQDIALAVARVEEAEALARVVDSQRWPSIDATGEANRSRSSQRTDFFFPSVPVYSNNYRATVNLSYEIDLWGRVRNASAAARADLLGTQAAHDTVRIALAADVAQGYFAVRAFDEQIAATARALDLRTQALDLQRKRAQAGIISELSLRQLEGEVAAARAQLPVLQRSRTDTELVLAVLLGRSPREIIDGEIGRAQVAEGEAPPAPIVPEGLPSELLLRRPDIYEAEQRMIAANARIGQARASLFPRIALTGYLGSESASLSDLFTGPAGIWLIGAQLAQPIFQGGRNLAEIDAAQARERQALALYQKTVQTAFSEVRNALVAQARAKETFDAEGDRVTALGAALKLAYARYDAGLASLLEAIDAERNLLEAELNRADALRVQRAAVADLFKALGGGWTEETTNAVSSR
jgi:multidrug efflux system outer membrane protein